MEMFLTVFGLSLVAVVVSALVFAAAVRPDISGSPVADTSRAVDTSRFFVQDITRPHRIASVPPVPLEVLLLQIERHVRLEQAAAESFHLRPTSEALHMHTVSPLVH
jgi:hypothetical protein